MLKRDQWNRSTPCHLSHDVILNRRPRMLKIPNKPTNRSFFTFSNAKLPPGLITILRFEGNDSSVFHLRF